MPIYTYQCSSCGVIKDEMQKVSAPPLTTCTVCGKETFTKQLTTPVLQFRGSGYHSKRGS